MGTQTEVTQAESARLWEPGLPGVELFEAKLFQHQFNKHFHETYTIGLNESGGGCCLHGGETLHFQPGSFNLINPGEVHTGQVMSVKGWKFRSIYIHPTLITQTFTQLELSSQASPAFKHPILWKPSLQFVFYQLFNVLNNPAAQLAQQSLLLELLSGLFLKHADCPAVRQSPRQESRAISQIRAYLEAHYAENVAIEDLARLVNLSPHYLIRCFRQQVGCAPHQYQRHWQLRQVKSALRSPQPLSVIAAEHGFYDQSHLNRAFKRTFGVTPGKYQKDNSVQYD
ncbi:MAG: AraC family transcriptional regulator [Cyanobacteria bacterium P01_F01_bin.86]